eukprot:1161275-Pelagomonas_calceolata.AAC.14
MAAKQGSGCSVELPSSSGELGDTSRYEVARRTAAYLLNYTACKGGNAQRICSTTQHAKAAMRRFHPRAIPGRCWCFFTALNRDAHKATYSWGRGLKATWLVELHPFGHAKNFTLMHMSTMRHPPPHPWMPCGPPPA